MDQLQEAAQYYKDNLENKEFFITAGKNQHTLEIVLKFDANNFKHLSGLHKLKDLPVHNYTSVYIYKQVLEGNITYEDINKSKYIKEIEPRLEYFSYIRNTVLTSKVMQKSRDGSFYSIKADVLITKEIDSCYINVFGKKIGKENLVVPVSFFPSDCPQYYSEKSNRWTILSVREIQKEEKHHSKELGNDISDNQKKDIAKEQTEEKQKGKDKTNEADLNRERDWEEYVRYMNFVNQQNNKKTREREDEGPERDDY